MQLRRDNPTLSCAAIFVGLAFAWPTVCWGQSENRVLTAYNRNTSQAQTSVPGQRPQPSTRVRQVAHQSATTQPQQQTKPPRLLGPRSTNNTSSKSVAPTGKRPKAPKFALPRIESFTTAGAGLAIVVGLFLVCMWLLRRSGPKPTSVLPTEAVAVLGKVPLLGRNFAQLMQVGNKLVLVAMTPEGVSPITEVTDPIEVQRLLGLCMRTNKHSTSAEFQDVLKHLTKEPASGFLGNDVAANYAARGK